MELRIDQEISKRFIVLITENLVNRGELAHKIHWMATTENMQILYLVLIDNTDNMLAVSRDMATMKALTSANKLEVGATLTETGSWLETLRKIACPGDVIICQEEQMVVNGLFKTIPIRDFLSSHLNSPVRTISGYYPPMQIQTKKWLYEVFGFLGFLIILAGFTWLQIRLDQALDDLTGKIMVMVTFCIEMSAIWAWYKFTYR